MTRAAKKPKATKRMLTWPEFEQWRSGQSAALRRALHDELRIYGKRAYLVYRPPVRGTPSYPDGEALFYVHATDNPEFYR
jgi:hypothetical protein